MNIVAKTPQEYMEKIPPDRKIIIEQLSQKILSAIPGSRFDMAHNMPAIMLEDKILFVLGSQKHYMSIYVMAVEALADHYAEFSHLKPGKSCIRFKKLADLPEQALNGLIQDTVLVLNQNQT